MLNFPPEVLLNNHSFIACPVTAVYKLQVNKTTEWGRRRRKVLLGETGVYKQLLWCNNIHVQTDGQPCLWLTVSKWPRHILDKAGFDVVWSAVGVGINCFHDRLSSDHIKLLGILLLTFPPIMIVLGVHCLLGSFLMPDQRERLFVCLFVC